MSNSLTWGIKKQLSDKCVLLQAAKGEVCTGEIRVTARTPRLAGTTDAVWKNTSTVSVNTPYTSAPLDVSWLTPGGTAYYSLRSSRDAAGVIPPANGNEYVRLGAGRTAT